MKKSIFAYAIVCAISISSCTNIMEDSTTQVTVSNSTQEKYRVYAHEEHLAIEEAIEILTGQSTSRATAMNIVQFIKETPPNVIDSLYQIYCINPKEEDIREATFSSMYDTLVEQTSIEDVQSVYEFANDYAGIGGNNIEMIKNKTKNTSPLIEDCIIKTAAIIDQRVIVSESSPRSNLYCTEMLHLKLIESGVESAIADTIIDALLLDPAADAAIGMVLAGVDLYSMIKMAHDYNLCTLSHIS